MTTLQLQRIPRFPKFDAREGQLLVAGGRDNLNEAPAAPPVGLQCSVVSAVQNELIFRAFEESAFDLAAKYLCLPRPLRLIHLRIEESLSRGDAQSCPASAGNGDRVVKAIVVIQLKQHPADGMRGNGQRTAAPS